MSFLIASVFADSVEELEALAASAWLVGADAVEARIDNFRDTPSDLNRFLRSQSDRKWLITCRSRPEGGLFVGDGIEAARRVLEAVEKTSAWIDVELGAWRLHGEIRSRVRTHIDGAPDSRVILSAHFLENSTPSLEPLVEEVLCEGPKVIAKVAYAGAHIADSFLALDLMHRHGPRSVAICMGEAGAWTRVLAKKLGAFATFASLDQAASTAPGQWSVEELRDDFGWDPMNASTKVFGVAGDPVAHSLSPKLFNHWFRQHHRNAVYVPLRIGSDRGGLAQFQTECDRRPWLNLSGLSVTVPHKVRALNWAGDTADPMSRAIGAANTLVLGENGSAAYNTDCHAAVDSLAHALGQRRGELGGITVDVLGAGGVARAVCYGLAEMGCPVTVFARSQKDTHEFAQWGVAVRGWSERVESSGEVLVNCTPMGMWPNVDESPMPAAALHGRRLVFDLIYRSLKTKLLMDAAASGCRTLGGLDMFVRQAATQFALWTGQTPDATGARRMLEMELECEAHRAARKNSLALIGARGSGKTTVGRLLSRILGARHVDIDEMVVASSGKTIRQIFSEQGEEEFRRLESDAVLLATGTKTPAVISMGGGAVLDPANVEAIRKVARIVWLTAPADALARRVLQDPESSAQRPRLTSGDATMEMEKMVRVREPLYRAVADFIVDTSQLDAACVALHIANWLRK